MKTISILDTTICDYNLGNQIIMDSINKILNATFKDDFIFRLQYAEKFGFKSLKYIHKSDYTFFGGTNSLSSQMNRYKQMGFNILDLPFIRHKITLLGVAWWQYQNKPNLYTQFLLNTMLSNNVLHSVRDEYTKNMLSAIGITNVLNTSCPTTWELTKEHCDEISHIKSENVITTLTDYNKSNTEDENLINLLLNNYKTVFYWIQGIGDLEYINSLKLIDMKRVKLIPPKLSEYDRVCKGNEVDYIGTRLHAGIRAIQHKKRALILAIDNRAKEISKDINLNISDRNDFERINSFIWGNYATSLNIPFKEIEQWKGQFE